MEKRLSNDEEFIRSMSEIVLLATGWLVLLGATIVNTVNHGWPPFSDAQRVWHHPTQYIDLFVTLAFLALLKVYTDHLKSRTDVDDLMGLMSIWTLGFLAAVQSYTPPVTRLASVLFLIASIAILLSAFSQATSAAGRERYVHLLQRVGLVAPLFYILFLVLSAVIAFANLAQVLSEYKIVTITDSSGRVPDDTLQYILLFVYLLAKGIPTLDLTDNFQWKAPLKYSGVEAGMVLTSFKLVVLVPTLAYFVQYIRAVRPNSGNDTVGPADADEASDSPDQYRDGPTADSKVDSDTAEMNRIGRYHDPFVGRAHVPGPSQSTE